MYSTASYETVVLAHVSGQLEQVFEQMRDFGREPESLGDPALLAERMVASIPRASTLNLELGPFYTTSSLTKWLGVSRQYVHELGRQKRILSLVTADQHRVYPAFQFGLKGALLPELATITRILEVSLEPRMIGMWLVTEKPALDGTAPAEWLKTNDDPNAVVRLAEHYAEVVVGESPQR